MRKIFTLLALLSLLAGCGGTMGQPTVQEEVVLNYGISNPWDALMPYNSPSASNYSRMIYDKIYDRLAYVHADGTLSPRAATSWEGTQDGMGVIFHLDERAQFHDGTPVTARHWADTIRRMTEPACPTLGRAAFAVLAGTDQNGASIPEERLGVEELDEYTLQLTFKTPMTPEDFLLDKNRELYVLPTHLLEEVALEETMGQELWYAPVGSGPCRYGAEVAGSRLELTANPDYQLGKPGFDRMVITVMDKSNLLTALMTGDLDYYAIGGSVSAEDAPAAEQAGLTVERGTVPVNFYELMLNNQSIPSPHVRRAIELALDKQLLSQQTAPGLSAPADTSILPGSPSDPYYGEAQARPRDVEEARRLLEAGGYGGDAYRLACTSNRSGLAALIQQNLADVGVETVIETVDSATLFSGMADGVYDMAIASHTPSALPLWFVESRFTPENNIFHVQDLEPYLEGIQAAKQAGTPQLREQALLALEALFQKERPFIPLWFSTALHVHSPTVSGIDYASASFSNENVWDWRME